MATINKKSVARNSVIANSIESSVYNLEVALEKANKAVVARTAESRKLMNEGRRLRKRRTTQIGRKRRAIAADKKNSTAESRKAVRSIVSELNTTSKTLTRVTSSRQAVLEELSGLKESQKTLNGYVKGIYAADRALAKSKKKKKT